MIAASLLPLPAPSKHCLNDLAKHRYGHRIPQLKAQAPHHPPCSLASPQSLSWLTSSPTHTQFSHHIKLLLPASKGGCSSLLYLELCCALCPRCSSKDPPPACLGSLNNLPHSYKALPNQHIPSLTHINVHTDTVTVTHSHW